MRSKLNLEIYVITWILTPKRQLKCIHRLAMERWEALDFNASKQQFSILEHIQYSPPPSTDTLTGNFNISTVARDFKTPRQHGHPNKDPFVG